MQNPQNREMMAELYRIMERYEVAPTDHDQQGSYIDGAMVDMTTFYHKWWEQGKNQFGRELAHAMYRAICAQCAPKQDGEEVKE